MPDVDGPPIYALGQAELAVVHRDVEALYFDMRVLSQLLDTLVINTLLANNPLHNNLPFDIPAADEARESELYYALASACAAIDDDDVAGSVEAARATLAPVLERVAGEDAQRVARSVTRISTRRGCGRYARRSASARGRSRTRCA